MIFQRIFPFIYFNVHLFSTFWIDTQWNRFDLFLEVQSSLELLPFFFNSVFISINKRRKVSLSMSHCGALYGSSQLLISLFDFIHVLFFMSFDFSVVNFSFKLMIFLENIFLKLLLFFELFVLLLHL